MPSLKIEPTLTADAKITAAAIAPLTATMTLQPFLKVLTFNVPREKLTVPIARNDPPRATDTFQSPDGKTHYYLPHYTLGEETTGGQTRYMVAFRRDEAGDRWGLEVSLKAAVPAALTRQSARLQPIPHRLTVTLSYRTSADGAARKSHSFADIATEGDTTRCTLWLTTLAERDDLYHTLTDPTREARLDVARSFSAATRVKTESTGDAGPKTEALTETVIENNTLVRAKALKSFTPNSTLKMVTARRKLKDRSPHTEVSMPTPELSIGRQKDVATGARKFTQYQIVVENWEDYSADLFRKMKYPRDKPRKEIVRMSVDLVDADKGHTLQRFDAMQSPKDLTSLLLLIPHDKTPPKRIVAALHDNQTDQVRKSKPLALSRGKPPQQALYTVREVTLTQTAGPVPFAFAESMHRYIYDALATTPPVPVQGGLTRHRESFDGLVHSYFQDAVSPTTIYFLPDDFRISRHGGGFRPPQMTVRVSTTGGDTDSSEVTLDYVLAPRTDLARLSDAAAKIGAATGIAPETLEFQPYLTPDIQYTLTRASTTGRLSESRPTSAPMLQEPHVDTLVMPVADFQIAFDAMVGETASAITGEMTITVDGWGAEIRRVIADFAQLDGAVLDVDDISSPIADHAALLRLTNAIESPVRLEDLRIMATRDGLITPVSGLDALGASDVLAPGESVAVNVTYPDLPGHGAATFEVHHGGTVEPDAEAIMDTILDRSALDYYREIMVKTVPGLLKAPDADPAPSDLHAMLVEFENGVTISLDHSTTQATARIDYPFSDMILRKVADDGSYRYFKTLIRYDGTMERDGIENTNTSSILFVTPFVTPAPDPEADTDETDEAASGADTKATTRAPETPRETPPAPPLQSVRMERARGTPDWRVEEV